MGKRKGGRGRGGEGGGGGGGFADQYGDGWGGGFGSRDDFQPAGGRGGGRGGAGGGGMKGGGDAGGAARKSAKGSNVSYERVVPNFLKGYEDLMRGGSMEDAAKRAWGEHDAAEALRGYGDDEDEEAGARKGLGARSEGPGGKAAAMQAALAGGGEISQEDKEELAKQEKGLGNRAFQDKNFAEAVKHFTVCIKLDPENHNIYYSNRSAAYASMKKFDEALADARKAAELQPEWAKAYARLGAAHMGLEAFLEAAEAYDQAFKLDPSNPSYEAYANNAREAEEKAQQEGVFKFKAKKQKTLEVGVAAKPEAAAVKKKPKERAGAVNNKTLLSFDEDE